VRRAIVEHPEARRDLGQIARYIAQRSPQSADRLLLAAERTYLRLASHPGIGALYAPHNPSFAGLRLCAVDRFRSYLIVYRAADDRVEVLRVLHAARDVDAILNDALGPPDDPA
jgi:toxin ParE1/3/4